MADESKVAVAVSVRRRRRDPEPSSPRGVTGAFGGAASQRPFARQQRQAARTAEQSRRRLPRVVVAAPPIIPNPSPRQVAAARGQIVRSIQANVGGATGRERQRRVAQVMREIQTDPRLAPARRSIAYYSGVEASRSRPQTRAQAKPGPEPRRIGPGFASINLTETGRALAKATPGLQVGDAPGQFVRNALKDIGTLSTAPFVGGYEIGAAAVEGVRDRPELAPLLLTGPLGLAAAALSAPRGQRLAKGVAEGTAQAFKGYVTDPGGSFREHPVLMPLDLAGAAAVAGRGAGALARAAGSTPDAAGVRGALARAGSTVRPAVALTDDPAGPIVQRTYSKDLTRKGAQAVRDAYREPLRREDGTVVTTTDRGRTVPVLKATEGEKARHLRGEADFAASRANMAERMVRDAAHREMKVRGVRSRKARDLVAMVVEGTITSARHFEDDLKAERARIAGFLTEHARTGEVYRHAGDVAAAQGRVKMIDEALSSPKVLAQKAAIVKAGEDIGRRLNEREREAVALGLLDERQARRARLVPAAVAHQGARYFREDELAALERAGVQVRDPAKASAHQQAAQAAKDAADQVRVHEGELRALHDERSRLVGAQSVRRGQELHKPPPLPRRLADDEAEALTARDLAEQRRHPDATAELRARQRARRDALGPLRASMGIVEFERAYYRKLLRDAADARELGLPVAARRLKDQAARVRQVADAAEYAARRSGHERDAMKVLTDWYGGEWRGPSPGPFTGDGALRAYYVGDQRFNSRNEAAAHARQHGGQVRAVALTAAEARRMGELARVDRAIANRRRELQAARKARHVANRKLRRTPKPPIREALRGPDGRFLPNRDIEDMLRARGRDPDTVAYLPHRQGSRGSFHQQLRPGTRGSLDTGQSRTGAAYAKGVTESSAKLIREQGVRQAVHINRAQAIDRMIGDQGVKHPSGRYFTAKEALEIADRLKNAPKAERLVPVRAFPAKLDEATQRIIRDDLQGPGAMESLGQRLLSDRIVTQGIPGDKGKRNVVLVPETYVTQLQKHLRPAGEILKLLQALNRPFRFAVLAQPRWLTGNFVEPFVVRLTVNGSGLNVFGLGMDIAAATRTLRRMERSPDPKMRRASQELRAQQLGGLFIGGRGANIRRSADEFEAYGAMVSRLPAVAQGFDLLRHVGRALMAPGNLFFRLNRAIENAAQRGALGRDIRRDLQQFTGSWLQTLRLQRAALDEAARGLVDTPTQRRFMRSQHEMLGKYEGFAPWMRQLVQGPLPFIPWFLNAARFTLWTMPAHHTALTALLTRVNDVMAKDWEEIHKNVPPGGLKFAVPTKDGGWVDLARYSPYGLTAPIVGAEGKNLDTLTDQFLPQFSGALAALTQGEDPFGRKLQLDPTENEGVKEPSFWQRAGIAGLALLEATAPYIAQARRVREGGGTAWAGSTLLDPDVKPGTDRMSGLRRTFDPFRPTYLGAGPSRPVPEPARGRSGPAVRGGVPPEVRRALRSSRSGRVGGVPPEVRRALKRGG